MLMPFLTLEYPWSDTFKVTNPPTSVNKGEYIWNINLTYPRYVPNPKQLYNDFLFIKFYTNPKGQKVTGSTFIGSAAVDIIGLVLGPIDHSYKLEHSDFEGVIKIKCNSKEIAPCEIVISSVSVNNLYTEESVFLEVNSETCKKLKVKLEPNPDKECCYINDLPIQPYIVPITYDQLSENFALKFKVYTQQQKTRPSSASMSLSDTLSSPSNKKATMRKCVSVEKRKTFQSTLTAISTVLKGTNLTDSLRKTLHIEAPINEIGTFDLVLFNYYEYSNVNEEREEEIYYENKPIIVKYCVSIKNYPRFVQSIRGTHINNGIIDKYTNLFYPANTIRIEEAIEKRDHFFRCEPACSPPSSSKPTIEPVEFKLTCIFYLLYSFKCYC